jgi:hypothetical protein
LQRVSFALANNAATLFLNVSHTRSSAHATLPDLLAMPQPRTEDGDPCSEIRAILPLASVPSLIVTHAELKALPLDSRAAFVLSLVDGRCDVETILDMTGMRSEEAFGILVKLVELRAIKLVDR